MTDIPDNDWRWDAACNNKWQLFDENEETGEYPYLNEARMFCHECPVSAECEIAGGGQTQGIWNGEIKGGKK